jgi:hypothetical protein
MKLYIAIILLVMIKQMMMVDYFKDEEEEPTDLEVAHIIPHSLACSNDASMQLVVLPLLVTLFN